LSLNVDGAKPGKQLKPTTPTLEEMKNYLKGKESFKNNS